MMYEQVNISTSTSTRYENAPDTQQEETKRVQQRLYELENTLKQYLSQKEVIR